MQLEEFKIMVGPVAMADFLFSMKRSTFTSGKLKKSKEPLPASHPKPRDVLFISRQRIVGRTNGSSAYLLDLAEASRQAGFVPHLLQPSPDIMGRWPLMRLKPDMNVFQTHEIRGVLRLGRWIVSLSPSVFRDALWGIVCRLGRRAGLAKPWLADRPRPYSIAAAWTQRDHNFVVKRGQARGDILIADYAFQAEAFNHLPGRPSAIVMHDLFHKRAAGSEGRDSVVQIDCKSEVALLSRADAVVAIQAAEAAFVAREVPGPRPILAPMAARPVTAAQPGKSGKLLFVGSNTAPNVLALEWFFKQVLPQLKKNYPELTLDVVGGVSAAFLRGGAEGVTFHGVVDQLAPFYEKAAVVISPLTFGSGLKVKLIEAMAHGKAIVATSVTLQGVEQECASAVLRADDATTFARSITSLRSVGRRRDLGELALAAAERHFSPQACYADFMIWLRESSKNEAFAARLQAKL